MTTVLPLSKSLRRHTISLRSQLKVGQHVWVYGVGGTPILEPMMREIVALDQRWVFSDKSLVESPRWFVAAGIDSKGIFQEMENYAYEDWNIMSYTSNWYISRNKEDADIVFQYLVFTSEILL